MKNKLLLILALVISGFAIISWTSDPGKKSTSNANEIPAGVAAILTNSCNACHGANGRAMALSHLKLAQWNDYSTEKQAEKAADICRMISAGKMPPKGYVRDNPALALSQAQIDSICAWSSGVTK
jgi:mono/diheme cytochrome c family protein